MAGRWIGVIRPSTTVRVTATRGEAARSVRESISVRKMTGPDCPAATKEIIMTSGMTVVGLLQESA